MGILKVSTLNNLIKFVSDTGEIQAYGRNDVEARTTETSITFYHKQKKYLQFNDTSKPIKENYALSDIRDEAGASLPSVGTAQEDVLSYLSDKISNFKSAGGGTASTTTVDTTNFDKNLSASDNTVLKALETIDEFVLSGSPDGADSEIQYNDSGSFGASNRFIWDNSSRELGISKDQSSNATGLMSIGSPSTFAFVGGTGKIEMQGVKLYIGGSNTTPANERGLLISTISSGAESNKVEPSINDGIDMGSNTLRFLELHAKTGFLETVGASINLLVGGGGLGSGSIFTVNSTDKGILLPRMNVTERDAITTPATSLLIYNTTSGDFEYYNGSAWVSITENAPVSSVNGYTGIVVVDADDISDAATTNKWNKSHTGDVTGATVLTISTDVVDNTKLSNVATQTIKGRITAGSGNPEDLSATQVRTLINVEDGSQVNDPNTVTQTSTSSEDGRLIRSDGTARVLQESGIKVTDDDEILGDNMLIVEETTSFVATGSQQGKRINLNSATDEVFTFPEDSTETIDTGAQYILHNINDGVWTGAVQGTDTFSVNNFVIKKGETAYVTLDSSGASQNWTIIGGHETVLDSKIITIPTVANKDYTIVLEWLKAGNITSVTTQSDSGTCTATCKINTTALGGTPNAVSSTIDKKLHTTDNSFVEGDKTIVTISSNSGCTEAVIQINIEYF